MNQTIEDYTADDLARDIAGTNNGYLFAPNGRQLRTAREHPERFRVQAGGEIFPHRIDLRPLAQSALTDRYARTVPAFRAKIGLIADIAGMTPLDVYSLWLEYSRKCSDYDQSAILGEFVDWHCDELGGDTAALRDALEGGRP